MRSKAEKWLAAGVAVGVLGIVVAILGATLPGIILAAIGVADLVIIALGYPSPMDLRRTRRALYQEEDRVEYDSDKAFASVSIAREDEGEHDEEHQEHHN